MAGKPAQLVIDIVEKGAEEVAAEFDKMGSHATSAAGDIDKLGRSLDDAVSGDHASKLKDSAEALEGFGGGAGDASTGLSALSAALADTGVADFSTQLTVASSVLDGMEGVTRLWTVATNVAAFAQAKLSAQVLITTVQTTAYNIAQQAAAVASRAWAAAQWLINVAMEANPIGLIIAGIVALIAVIAVLWVKSETFRDVVLAIWGAIQTAAVAVWDVLKAAARAALDFISGYIRAWQAIITAVFGAVRAAGTAIWDAVRSAAVTLFNFLRSFISAEIDGWKRLFGGISGAISSAFNTAKDAVLSPINKITDTIQKLIDKIKSLIDWIGKIHLPNVGGLLDKLNPFSAVAPQAPSALSTRTLAATGLLGGATGRASAMAATAGVGLASLTGGLSLRVYIGDRELTDIIGGVVDASQDRLARRITGRAGVLR